MDPPSGSRTVNGRHATWRRSRPLWLGRGPLMASDDLALIRALVDAGVDFIVIGGVAGQLLGSPVVTFDLDICYARDDRTSTDSSRS